MHKRPRVLQIFKYYHPHLGGVERVAQQIAEGLKDEIDSRVLVCGDGTNSVHDVVNGIEVVRAGTVATYFSVPLAPRFPFLMRSMAHNADILHFHLPYPLADVSYLLVRPRKRIVVWWHSEIVRPKQLSKLYKPFLAMFLKKADRIIVAAPQLVSGSPFLSRFREKCTVIPIGINARHFDTTPEVEKKAEQIRQKFGPTIVLFIGRLIYYKGVEYLIEAMEKLRDPDAKLLIIGEGRLKSGLQTFAAERGIADRVVFLGEVSNEEVVAYCHACRMLVLPSVASTEAFGIVQLEAMACGRPVISTDLPTGVTYVNLHGKTGLIVRPKDSDAIAEAISMLLCDSALADKYGETGRQRVAREFTVEGMLRDVLSVYREVLNGC